MDTNNILLENMEMYCHGKMNFIVDLCEQLKLPKIFNMDLQKNLGRNTDIAYEVMAEMMIVNICDEHHPLYRLKEYYEMKDLEEIFHCPIPLDKVNDDRFEKFFDEFYEAQPRKIFSKLSTQAFATYVIEKRKRGRQPNDINKIQYTKQYYLQIEMTLDEEKVQKQFEEACTFVLCTNNLNLSTEDILEEYKTQSGVEKKFQQLKSPHFVNSLYLNTPERIEALTYLILISMMILSVAEHVVRRELKAEEGKIIGPGGVKMKEPTLWAILEIFNVSIGVKVLSLKGKKYRSLARPLKDSHKKILKYLSIPENVFYWEST